jgi:hypothetical protein
MKERDLVRAQLSKINEEMTALREAFNKEQEAWNTWREVARQKYTEKIEAERKERQRRYLERINAEKIAAKKARAAKRQNPFEAEINAINILVGYLKDRLYMARRDDEDRQKRASAATFDPSAYAPAGCIVVAPDVVQSVSKQKRLSKPAKTEAPRERHIQHNEEKLRLFAKVEVEAPMSLTAIEGTIEQLKSKKAEFESHIKPGELVLSSDEEADDENDEAQAPETTA